MRVSRKRKHTRIPTILLEDVPLEHVDTFKYLGVTLSSDLSWTPHIESVCTLNPSKCKFMRVSRKRKHTRIPIPGNSWVYYTGASIIQLDPNTLLELYTTQIRPHLEYAATVWDPYSRISHKHQQTGKYTEAGITNIF